MKMKINQTERNKMTNRSINNRTSKTFYKNLNTSIKRYNKLNMRKENETKEKKMKKKTKKKTVNQKQNKTKQNKTNKQTNKHPIDC